MYTIYNTIEEALEVNMAEAASRGCDPNTTTEWWPRLDHPTNGMSALQNGGGVTQDDLQAQGWFQTTEDVSE